MKSRILLVNPPIYDFAAYDFWVKPYGLLSVAGYISDQAEFFLFDYMDRQHPFMAGKKYCRGDRFNRGRFYHINIDRPWPLSQIPRYYRRFGLDRNLFRKHIEENCPFDFALVQTVMTYWYPGVKEAIEDIRAISPETKIILGGNYATLCPQNARGLQPDLVISGNCLETLWSYMNVTPDITRPALWQAYPDLKVGITKLTDGCPFRCTYCCVPHIYKGFNPRPNGRALDEIKLLAGIGATDLAFYDDALLFNSESVLMPFLEELLSNNIELKLHCPNALNARFLTAELAGLMIRAGFKTFYLGFESVSSNWQKQTGGKVFSQELAAAVKNLLAAGADPRNITAYQILGHPDVDIQQLEQSMYFVNSLGIRGMLADFSPVPGTVDYEKCGRYADMNEPLNHNKTAFAIFRMGFDESNRLKDLQRKLNRRIGKATS